MTENIMLKESFKNILLYILIDIICKMCFDSKVVDDPKRLLYRLTFSKVNTFLHKVDFCCI